MSKRGNSSAARITHAYNRLLVILMLLVSFSTITVVGIHLIKNKHDDSVELMKTLKASFDQDEPDWQYWHENTPVNTHHTFARIQVKQDKKTVQRYYTRNTRRFLDDTWSTWPLISNVQYQGNQGVYYHTRAVEQEGQLEVVYDTWLSLNGMIEIFKMILLMSTGITLLGLLVGSWATRVLARRLNQPLVTLTSAAKVISDAPSPDGQEALPVPQGPEEVRELTVEFNRLLHSLKQQVVRDNQFVSDASHELRTPLTAIRGHVALLQRHGKAHPELFADSLAVIDDESQKMQQLIESLLALSRMENAQMSVAAYDLVAQVKRVVSRYQQQTSQTLKVIVPERLMVQANAEAIEHTLLALLSNARKYAPANSVVTIQITKGGQRALLSVADLGPGIPDAEKGKIFDRFYRVDESRSKAIKGTGLGLAIAKQLTTLSGGELSVVDNVPQGSRFMVHLPLAVSENL